MKGLKKEVKMLEWYEELPENCPPVESEQPRNQLFYRLCKIPLDNRDFLSHRKLFPNKVFNTTECITRSLSIWVKKENCLALQKLPSNKNKSLVEIKLKNSDGLISNTFKPYHYSWWRNKDFDISQCRIIEA